MLLIDRLSLLLKCHNHFSNYNILDSDYHIKKYNNLFENEYVKWMPNISLIYI